MPDDPLSVPAPVWRPAAANSPTEEAAQVEADADSVHCQWFRAVPDTGFDPARGKIDAAGAGGEYRYEPQPGTHSLIVQDSTAVLRRFFPQGDWESGTVSFLFDPATFDIGEHDRFIVQPPDGAVATPKAAGLTLTQKEVMLRGKYRTPGAGLLATTGAAGVGTGTAFLSFFLPGDVLMAGHQAAVVLSVQDDLHLTLTAALGRDVIGSDYAKGRDQALYSPLASLDFVRGADGTVYVPGRDVTYSQDRKAIQWLSPLRSPAPGTRYSLIYAYHPTYQVLGMGRKHAASKGRPLLVASTARLVKPEFLTQ